jgi:hypothetical protein
MNPTTKALHAIASVALALTATLTSAAGQRRVTMYVDDSDYATEQAMTYEATCPSGKYKLRVNQNDNRVEFEFDGPTRTTVDLSSTPFGETFLGKALHGKFYSKCKENGAIRIVFYGIEPKDGPTLKGVRYGATIGSDGVIIHYDPLDEESAVSINGRLLGKFQQQSATDSSH